MSTLLTITQLFKYQETLIHWGCNESENHTGVILFFHINQTWYIKYEFRYLF